MKQSSIEWLYEQLDNLLPFIDRETAKKFNELIEEAKEMHKQEVIEAYIEFMNTDGIPNEKELAEQYYNETYNIKS